MRTDRTNVNPYDDWSTEELVDLVVGDAWGLPVRAMETLLERGDVVLEVVRQGLRTALADEHADLTPLWPVVLLGELGSPDGVADLAEALRSAAESDVMLPMMAGEALAKIGTPAIPALRSLISSGGTHQRLWAYAALSMIADEEAHELLVAALADDPQMVDVVSSAFADHERAEAILMIHQALRVAEPWQRRDLEDAIQRLHHGEPIRRMHQEDWRLRYRVDPVSHVAEITWPMLMSILRKQERFRAASPPPLRPLEEIIGEPWVDIDPEPCECCGAEYRKETGVNVCPATALQVALIQWKMLGEIHEAEETNDVFDVLDFVEAEMWDVLDREEPRRPRSRTAREDHVTSLHFLRGACMWLIESGVESVSAGRALLLAEASRLADRYGDPDGLLSPRRPRGRETPSVGRNDPCPCGSGRKYKKCCGRASIAADAAPAGEREATRPTLVTFDREPVSFGRAHYRMTNRAAVSAALSACPDLELKEDGTSFVWHRQVDEDEWRILGHINIEDDRLVLGCMSDQRLKRGRELLERVAGQWLIHKADSHQDPWQAVDHAAETGVPPAKSDLPPEVEAELIQKVLRKHYRTWPDESLPALGGRTAREAAGDRRGRQEVADLLRSMEELEAQKPAGQRYDFSWMWADLGIEHMR